MPKIMRTKSKNVIKSAPKKIKIVEDPNEKAQRIANVIMNSNFGSVDNILIENFSEYWLKRGAMRATDIVACIGKHFDSYCIALDRISLLDKTHRHNLKTMYYDKACKRVKQVLCLFRKKCNRKRLMKNLLDEDGVIFPWSVIKDDDLDHSDYTLWRHNVFKEDLLYSTENFYMGTKIRVLQWFAEFEVERSNPESVVEVLVKFCDLFKNDIHQLWNLCKVNHSRRFVEEVYSRCFEEHDSEEDLKHMEHWILSLGYTQSVVDEIKSCLW